MAQRLNQVRCKSCQKIIGHDPIVKEIEKCWHCKKAKKVTQATESSNFARVKKGPALDLGPIGEVNFRSGWERNFARWLTASQVEWTFERVSFTFTIHPKTKKPYKKKPWVYIPDFLDVGNNILYEVKGYLRSEDRSKIRRLKENYPAEFKKLKAVCSKTNKDAVAFYTKFEVPVIFIETLRDEYRSLVKEDYWEGK